MGAHLFDVDEQPSRT